MTGDSRSFLGTGWRFPPTFTRSSHGVEMVSAEKDIQESLGILFSTSLGERVMVPDYGCNLRDYLFQILTKSLASQMKAVVMQAIVNWEPRIHVLDVRVEIDANVTGLATLTISYAVRHTNTRSNFVYPFSTIEATIPSRVHR